MRLTVPHWDYTKPGMVDEIRAATLSAAMAKLQKYEDAEEQGLLVRLPCKIGDMAYYLRGTTIYGDTVERIIVDGLNNQIVLNAKRAYLFCDVGRNLFFTYAEADAALKRGQNDG